MDGKPTYALARLVGLGSRTGSAKEEAREVARQFPVGTRVVLVGPWTSIIRGKRRIGSTGVIANGDPPSGMASVLWDDVPRPEGWTPQVDIGASEDLPTRLLAVALKK
jgi:hypothetical protein